MPRLFQGHFSLLFHASIDNNYEAFRILIEAGARADWVNQSGTSVLKLILKRGQTDMFKLCIQSMSEEERNKFVNGTSKSGTNLKKNIHIYHIPDDPVLS